MIRVVVAGALGRMGQEAVKAIHGQPDLQLAGAIARREAGRDVGELVGIGPIGVPVETDLETVLDREKPDVLLELTLPESAPGHVQAALKRGIRPVVGTSGVSGETVSEWWHMAQEKGVGALICPNFAVGAVLMMRFAEMAAPYFDGVEIIELHHDAKKDKPSGTAIRTQAMLREAGHDAPIHSVRLKGIVANQEVIFGTLGQTLTIRHDTINREAFMPGVLLAVRRVGQLRSLEIGLEKVL